MATCERNADFIVYKRKNERTEAQKYSTRRTQTRLQDSRAGEALMLGCDRVTFGTCLDEYMQ